jgi:amino acid adenylation domain-containing protein
MNWSNEIAVGLSKITKPSDTVILSFPAGLEFIACFYACLMVGIIAVPVAHPSNRKHHWIRVKQISDDCNAALLLTNESAVPIATQHWSELTHPPIFGLKQLETSGELPQYTIKPSDIAYLQYTSGSTSAPKGVIMTHQNIIHNIMAIESGFSLDASDVVVSWLPHHHDQGLVGIILIALWVGIPAILMAPVAFLQNPFHWLHAISRYRGTYSGGPNFGFSFCVDKYSEENCKNIDLSSWKVAFNGAEPIRSDTLDDFAKAFSNVGFSANALAPCYGLAEATLAVTMTPTLNKYSSLIVDKTSLEQREWQPSEKGVALVSSGEICGNQSVVIVDPEHLQETEPNNIGEIWISGPSVSQGYWKNKEQTIKSMGIKLPSYPEQSFLRTGDLGYIHQGNLFVVGRIKDVIIIRGRNHYPQDIELTVNQTSEVFRKSGCAAFSCEIDSVPQLIVVQEIERVAMRKFNASEARRKVIEHIALNHEIKVHEVVFIRPVSLPKTSSGKVQRSLAKQMYINGTLKKIKEQKSQTKSIVSNNLSLFGNIANKILGEPVDLNSSLLSLGFDSIEIIRFKQEIESKLSVTIPMELLFENHPISELESKLQTHQNKSNVIETSQSTDLDIFKMAKNQKSLWLAQKMQPHSGVFNLAVPLILHREQDKNTLNSAWQSCLERHPILAMSINNIDESSDQFIPSKHQNQIIFHEQMTTWGSDKIAKEIRRLAQCPPDLQEPELASLHCWRQSSSTQVLSFIIHHVLVDMWSLLNLLDEFLQLISGISLSNTPTSYSNYVAQSHRKTQQSEADLIYWKKKFQNTNPQALRLPGNPMRPEKRSGHANSIYFNIGTSQTNALKNIAKHHNSSMHTLLLAIYGMVLTRFSGQSEINIGGPTFGREDACYNSTVGFFVNTVVYQLMQDDNLEFTKYLQTVKDEARKVIQHQHAPFSEVVKVAGIPNCPGIHPLYQTSFTLQKSHRLVDATPMIVNGPSNRSFSVYGQEVSTFPMPQHSCQVDIALTMADFEGALQARLDFSTDVLSSRLAKQLASSLEQVICQLPNHISSTIGNIPIQKKHSPLIEDLPSHKTNKNFVAVNQTLLKSMQFCANQSAIIWQNESFEYKQIALWTARVAGHLKRLNVSQGDVVALACSRSPYWVSAMLAIWQIGAIYVPIDDSLPETRVTNILQQVSPQLVLVEDDRLEFLAEKVNIKELLNKEVETAACVKISSKDPAYIIFTSGTTGLPKGAIVNHGSLSNRLDWMSKKIPLMNGERVLHKTPISFDVSLWECLWPLYSGATCVIADDMERKNPVNLADLMRKHKVSTAQFVPSFLSVFIDIVKSNWPNELTRIICGGEELKPDLVERLDLNSLALHNLYGPTETGFVTHKEIKQTQDALSLGDSIDYTQVLILDRDDRPSPLGAIGEIVVVGEAVGLGYVKQANTKNKFGVTDSRVHYYRTGDMAEYNENRQIKFLGREDRQVKLRGFRIELPEIESVLLKHPEVITSHCSVVGEDALGQLFAWVHSTNSDITDSLIEWCRKHLPKYMSPDHIILLDKWPLTAHGKLNTQLLPKDFCNDQAENELPEGFLEETIAEIWANLLNQNLIFRETNFFSAGGHSLLAAIMANRIKEKFGITPDIQLIFREPQLKNYAQNLNILFPNNFKSTHEEHEEKEEYVI